jgi:hypothetical protein
VYELKKAGELGEGPAFTARLEVDYKAPMPASADVLCTARVEKIEGRKVGLPAPTAARRELFRKCRSWFDAAHPERKQHNHSGLSFVVGWLSY